MQDRRRSRLRGRAGGGIFVTDLTAKGALALEASLAWRGVADVVTRAGSTDGTSDVDCKFLAACGVAITTGPQDHAGPREHRRALPGRDRRTPAVGILVAEPERRHTGRGRHVGLSLSAVATETRANVGVMARAEIAGVPRLPQGSLIHGSVPRDFATRDGRRFMVGAMAVEEWRALVAATGPETGMAAPAGGADLTGERARDWRRTTIAAHLQARSGARDLAEVTHIFGGTAVCRSLCPDVAQMRTEDPRPNQANATFAPFAHPGVPPALTPAGPLRASHHPELAPAPPPAFGRA